MSNKTTVRVKQYHTKLYWWDIGDTTCVKSEYTLGLQHVVLSA